MEKDFRYSPRAIKSEVICQYCGEKCFKYNVRKKHTCFSCTQKRKRAQAKKYALKYALKSSLAGQQKTK